jgi:hypothetical protein
MDDNTTVVGQRFTFPNSYATLILGKRQNIFTFPRDLHAYLRKLKLFVRASCLVRFY